MIINCGIVYILFVAGSLSLFSVKHKGKPHLALVTRCNSKDEYTRGSGSGSKEGGGCEREECCGSQQTKYRRKAKSHFLNHFDPTENDNKILAVQGSLIYLASWLTNLSDPGLGEVRYLPCLSLLYVFAFHAPCHPLNCTSWEKSKIEHGMVEECSPSARLFPTNGVCLSSYVEIKCPQSQRLIQYS